MFSEAFVSRKRKERSVEVCRHLFVWFAGFFFLLPSLVIFFLPGSGSSLPLFISLSGWAKFLSNRDGIAAWRRRL